MDKLLTGTLVLSGLTNIALLSDISRIEKKTDKVIDTLNRAHLIATLYVLKEKKNQIKFKEEKDMKKFGKFSNRTKVIGGVTVLLGAATIISAIKDSRDVSEIEEGIEILELVPEGAEELVDTATEIVDDVVSAAEF